MNVITPTKKVAILRRFVDFRDLKGQEPENVLSRDISRAPYKTKKKKRQKYTHVEKKNEKNETITYTVRWFMKKKKKKRKEP